MNKKGFVKGRFSWQQSYGAFSYKKSNVDKVIDYIKNQVHHHRNSEFIQS